VLVAAAAAALRGFRPEAGLPSILAPEDPAAGLAALRTTPEGGALGPLADGAGSLALALAGAAMRLEAAARRDAGDWLAGVVADPAAFWVVGRLVSAAFGTATVVLVAAAARREGFRSGALAAALLLAIASPHVGLSRLLLPDAAAACCALAAILLAPCASRAGRAGFVAAAAAAWAGGAPPLPLAVALLVALGAGEPRRGAGALLLPALVAVALDPGAAWQGARAVESFAGRVADGAGVAAAGSGAAAAAMLRAVRDALGPGTVVLAAFAIGRAALRGPTAPRAHAVFVACVLAFAALRADPSPRAWLAALPSAALLAGTTLETLARRVTTGAARVAAGVIAAAAVLAVEPASTSVAWIRAQRGEDTRSLAAGWIRAHVAHRTRIVVPAASGVPDTPCVPLPASPRTVADAAERSRGGRAWYWRLAERRPPEPPFYGLVVVDESIGWGSLPGYRDTGAEVVVLPRPGPPSPIEGANPPSLDEARRRLRRELLAAPDMDIAATLLRGEDAPRGPDLEIWRVTPPGGRARPRRASSASRRSRRRTSRRTAGRSRGRPAGPPRSARRGWRRAAPTGCGSST
jgi:hypothetical protein